MNAIKRILCTPFTDGKFNLKNKVVMNPVPTGFVKNGIISSENIEFYRLRAKSVGMIIVGAVNISDPTATNNSKVPDISDQNMKIWKNVTDNIHEEDCKVLAEIWHSGSSRAFGNPEYANNVSSPSGVVGNKKIGEALKPIEIEDIISEFVIAARNAKKAGFDGIDIHGAHGSLIHDFLDKETNKRTDGYGIENRTKFAEEIIKRCREAVGEDFIILFRLSNYKMYDLSAKLTDSSKELRSIVQKISDSGVDGFDCSALNFDEDIFENEKGNLAYWAKVISAKPVIITGGVGSKSPLYKDIPKMIAQISSNPQMSYKSFEIEKPQITDQEKLIKGYEAENFDLVAFGRPLLINENWVKELKEKL
jgi:NADH:flavin oxidoreductases, Old Yellow Enzyme family